MKRVLLLVLLIFSRSAFSYNTYYLLVDPKFTPYASSSGFIFLHHAFASIEEELIKNLDTESPFVRIIGRAANLLFIWEPINGVMVTTQHEVFGHGYRIRDLGKDTAQVSQYKIKAPFPYGRGGGSTSFALSTSATTNDILSIDIAGVNATAILANRIKQNLMQKGCTKGSDATFYLGSQHDFTLYAQHGDDVSYFLFDSNDITDYIKWLNITYPSASLSKAQLRRLSLINLIDPMTFYTFFSLFQYTFTGNPTKVWMIPIKNISYLPNARLGLSPYGPEYFFENFLLVNHNPLYFYLKGGSIAGHFSFGLGLEYPKLYTWQFSSLGFRLDFWKQPVASSPFSFVEAFNNSKIGIDNEFTYTTRIGGALSLIGEQQVPNSPVSLYGQIGYKTKGFLPGESLDAAGIFRFGFGITF